MDIFKMANEIAGNISSEDKSALENMDMEKMISHVTQNVFKMMGNLNGSSDLTGDDINPFDIFSQMGLTKFKQEKESDTENENKLSENKLSKTKNICFDLNVDLKDFFTGKKKKINVKRKRIVVVDGKQKIIDEKKQIIVQIEKGMKDEQQIRFEGEADQLPGYKPGDIIVTLIENDHAYFQRDGNNLIFIKNIDLYENYNLTFDINHLDSRILRITKDSSDALHLNDSIRKITGEGMPIYKSNGKNGDLYIKFNLIIPKSVKNLEQVKEIFYENSANLNNSFDKSYCLEYLSDDDEDEDSVEETSSDDSSVSSVSSSSSSTTPKILFKFNTSLK